jgi:hypothetical protein
VVVVVTRDPSPGRRAEHLGQLLGGAGGVTGSIEDLVAYAKLVVDPPPELASAVTTATQPRGGTDTGLGWVTSDGLTWHNGGSHGYASLVVLDLEHNRAAGYLAASGDLGHDSEDLVFALVRDLRTEATDGQRAGQ